MATNTTNLNMELVSGSEPFNTDKVMDNFQKIDDAVGSLNENLATTTVLYENKALISGIMISVYKTGNTVTCKIGGSSGATINSGQKDAYVDLPDRYLPQMAMNHVCITQTGKKYIFNVNNVSKKAGIYYVVDSISTNEQVYAIITWAAKQTN